MGGTAFRSRPYDLAVDTISDGEIDELKAWLGDFPRLTMADETRRFEQRWAEWLGVKYAVMCNSGSSANLLMYAAEDALNRQKRRVAVPATGWVTSVAPALQLGFEPFMCESNLRTFGMDLDALETLIQRERLTTVLLVHVLGVPVDMTRMMALARQYGLTVLEDCCASHGALHQGRKVGTFGRMSSFSFYYGHHMSTVEGGVVCTDDEQVYHTLLMLRSHGWLKDLPQDVADRYRLENGMDLSFRHPFLFVLPGYNVRPTDLQAHIGLRQLAKLDDTIARRVANHQIYQKRLAGKLMFAEGVPGDTISSISFCAVARSTAERQRVVEALVRNKIDTRLFTAGNLGRHPFWADRFGAFRAPVADRLYECGFFLPNNQSLNAKDIDFVCDVVCEALR